MAKLSDINSCTLKAKFDFAITDATGKWSTQQQAYKLNALRMANVSQVEANYGYEVVETKHKVRGNGKALIIRFESEDGKDFELLGWGVPFEAETD